MMILFDDEFVQKAALKEQYRDAKAEAALAAEKTLREASFSEEIIQRVIKSILELTA